MRTIGKFVDLTGKRFGRLLVLGRSSKQYYDYTGKHKILKWRCRCDCGNELDVRAALLKNGTTRSCGCLRRDMLIERNYVHGHAHSKLYEVWAAIKARCLNPNNQNYYNYGGRGIKICEEWKNNFAAFEEWALQNGYNPDLSGNDCSIDRVDGDGDYCPENCRWVDRYVQNNNQKSNCLVTYKGETHSIGEWARILNMNRETLDTRLKCPTWSLDEAFTIPVGKYKGKQRRAEKNKLKEKENNGIHA